MVWQKSKHFIEDVDTRPPLHAIDGRRLCIFNVDIDGSSAIIAVENPSLARAYCARGGRRWNIGLWRDCQVLPQGQSKYKDPRSQWHRLQWHAAYSDTPLTMTLWAGPKSFINRLCLEWQKYLVRVTLFGSTFPEIEVLDIKFGLIFHMLSNDLFIFDTSYPKKQLIGAYHSTEVLVWTGTPLWSIEWPLSGERDG